jgi:hypothetical protein
MVSTVVSFLLPRTTFVTFLCLPCTTVLTVVRSLILPAAYNSSYCCSLPPSSCLPHTTVPTVVRSLLLPASYNGSYCCPFTLPGCAALGSLLSTTTLGPLSSHPPAVFLMAPDLRVFIHEGQIFTSFQASSIPAVIWCTMGPGQSICLPQQI